MKCKMWENAYEGKFSWNDLLCIYNYLGLDFIEIMLHKQLTANPTLILIVIKVDYTLVCPRIVLSCWIYGT